MFKQIAFWAQANGHLLWILGIASILMFVGSLIAIPIIVTRIPADYFVRDQRSTTRYWAGYPLVRVFALALKNLLGLVLLLAGIAMLVLPGQGVLTMLMGISLMNFPGKRQLELKIVSQPAVVKAINWIREKGNKSPLQLPQ